MFNLDLYNVNLIIQLNFYKNLNLGQLRKSADMNKYNDFIISYISKTIVEY